MGSGCGSIRPGVDIGFRLGFGWLGDLLRIRWFPPNVSGLRVRWFLPIGVRGRRITVSLGAVLEGGQLGAGWRRCAQLASELRVPRLTGG